MTDIISAGAGFLFGGTAGILKNTTPFLFATASSIRCFGLGTSYWAARGTILHAWTTTDSLTPTTLIAASTISGGLSGGTFAAITRGRSNVIPGVLMWSLFGGAGQWAANRWNGRDRSEAPTSFWHRVASSRWSPIKAMTDDEYAEVLRERMMKVEVEIAIVDERIAALKQQQQAVEQETVKDHRGQVEK